LRCGNDLFIMALRALLAFPSAGSGQAAERYSNYIFVLRF
jgi:hypothetical protein